LQSNILNDETKNFTFGNFNHTINKTEEKTINAVRNSTFCPSTKNKILKNKRFIPKLPIAWAMLLITSTR
jgi:hypothetical protein